MPAWYILLQLAGAVLLLLYSTRMVRTGIERAAGPSLGRLLLQASSGRLRAALVGIVVATFLQSATAVAILSAGFATTQAINLASALSIVIGADLGSAIVVKVLSLRLDWLVPALLLAGGLMFLKLRQRLGRQIGRVLLGIALILVSLSMISEATLPLRDSPWMPTVMHYLANDVVSAFLGGALLAVVLQSSVASMLLLASLCTQQVLVIETAIPLLLGVNAGIGLVPYWLTRDRGARAQRVTLGNALFRMVTAIVVTALLARLDATYGSLGPSDASQLINAHLLFNALLVLLAIPLTGGMQRMLTALVPDDAPTELERIRPASALDATALRYPRRALSCVIRELLQTSQMVQSMAASLPDLLQTPDEQTIKRTQRMSEEVHQAHTGIKLYIAELNRADLKLEATRRSIDLSTMAINLERASDILSRDLVELIRDKHRKGIDFSAEGWKELLNLHRRVMDNIEQSLNVLVSEDLDSARELIIEKGLFRKFEHDMRDRHLSRLTQGTPESIATSDMHLEIIRALKEINSLYAAIAYPILSRHGQLLDDRLARSGT